MLVALQSLYVNSTLYVKINGTAGQPALLRMGVSQGCQLSPTMFGSFFHKIHDHLQECAHSVGLQLRSGRWVSSLVYADDVVLLSLISKGLHQLVDGMHAFCIGIGLIVSPTTTEVVVFGIAPSDTHEVFWKCLAAACCKYRLLGYLVHDPARHTITPYVVQQHSCLRVRAGTFSLAMPCLGRLTFLTIPKSVHYLCAARQRSSKGASFP